MISVFFSCEHATCAVPEAWREVFRGSEERVSSDEGWQPGALNLAQGFATKFRSPLSHGDVTRLLIDLEAGEAGRWSEFSKGLTEVQQGKIRDRYERPFLAAARHQVSEALKREPMVVQLLVYVAPALEGEVRLECLEGDEMAGQWLEAWARELRAGADALEAVVARVPKLSSVASLLREEFGADRVAVLALRVSSTFFLEGRPWRWERLRKRLVDSLYVVAEQLSPAPESPSSVGC